MPSPFPGMDPYLEDPAFWRDFHGEFIYACRQLILDKLPPQYDAAVGEHLRLLEVNAGAEVAARRQVVSPDVSITEQHFSGERPAGTAAGAGTVATVEPVILRVTPPVEVRERWIEIIHRPEGALVTAVEVLSPTNKNSDGLGEYRMKRQAMLRQQVNLVELDLLLGGKRVEPPSQLPAGDYFALVSRADQPCERAVYAWPLRHALPAVPIPLRKPDGDVSLDLGAALTLAYDRGRFERRLRYTARADAPLCDVDRGWAESVARAAVKEPR